MKRPHLVHFLAIRNESSFSIKASLNMEENKLIRTSELDNYTPSFPIQALRLLNAYQFTMKLIGLNENNEVVYKKNFDSDSFGNLFFKVPLSDKTREIKAFQTFEIRKNPGLEFHLGNFIPLHINSDKKIVICDFDKTLVDTRYSTTKEVYRSLTSPIENFPTVHTSVNLIKEHIEGGFHPFILSASPHFYENAIRDWLYKNQIYTAGVFLKDYREVFSIFDGGLSPKDLKIQGLYKLNHLLDILLMTGIPDDLTLMGDNFESDPVIYLTLSKLLLLKNAPRELWSRLIKSEAFSLNRKQKAQILNKMFQLHSMVLQKNRETNKACKLKIFIRKKANEEQVKLPRFYQPEISLISLYHGRNINELTE